MFRKIFYTSLVVLVGGVYLVYLNDAGYFSKIDLKRRSGFAYYDSNPRDNLHEPAKADNDYKYVPGGEITYAAEVVSTAPVRIYTELELNPPFKPPSDVDLYPYVYSVTDVKKLLDIMKNRSSGFWDGGLDKTIMGKTFGPEKCRFKIKKCFAGYRISAKLSAGRQTIIMPSWAPTTPITARSAEGWRKIREIIWDHELTHVRINRGGMRDLSDLLNRIEKPTADEARQAGILEVRIFFTNTLHVRHTHFDTIEDRLDAVFKDYPELSGEPSR